MSGRARRRILTRQRSAAELRAHGLSLRETAARLKVSHMTVSRDLAGWDRTRPSQKPGADVTPDLRLGDFREVLADLEPGSADAVITDPPYPREYLPLYEDLAAHAAKWLKPGGICAVMSGQMHLPEVMARLAAHLEYHWVMAYETPGDAVKVWARRARSQWKPVLLYRNGEGPLPRFFGDLARSTEARGDKRLHPWAQAESGMKQLVLALTVPGELIVDPFAGSGTTGAVALALGRRFLGAEISRVDHQIAAARLTAARADEPCRREHHDDL